MQKVIRLRRKDTRDVNNIRARVRQSAKVFRQLWRGRGNFINIMFMEAAYRKTLHQSLNHEIVTAFIDATTKGECERE
jgi:muconolactone delta-isomerase